MLFDWASIPWEDLAFPTVSWALLHHQQYADWTAQVSLTELFSIATSGTGLELCALTFAGLWCM